MKLTIRCVLMGCMLLFLNGCGQKSAKLQRSVVPPDKTLFETGTEYLESSQYIRARLAFQTLISTYPDSEMAALSYYSIANSFYEEGGTENLLQAEDQYKNFIVFYPKHPLAADAQMKVISANMKLMQSPDRDQQYSYSALREIKAFMQRFPDNDYVPIVRQFKMEVEENLANGDLGVGNFYADRGNYYGAVGRYQGILDEYKDFSRLDVVYFRIGDVFEKAKDPDNAATYYEKIVRGYPFSDLFEKAKERLKLMNKPVPEVDTQVAAANQARLKPDEGFSPLKPFIDFGKALGFVGVPDRYDEAQKTLEETKRAAAGEAAAGGPKEGDIQIETIIRKSASGETEETTTLGGSTQKDPQGKKDKKTESD
jgi:outer membrane protein assembly factor BamD